jgi:hypothetical protein
MEGRVLHAALAAASFSVGVSGSKYRDVKFDKPLGLTPEEISDVEAFLQALT